jgi:hypothetical protein
MPRVCDLAYHAAAGYQPPAAIIDIDHLFCGISRFILGQDPSIRLIAIGYNLELAAKHAHDFRATVNSSWYQRLFPFTQTGAPLP